MRMPARADVDGGGAAKGADLDWPRSWPELLFKLRKVDEKDLIAEAGKGLPLAKQGPAADKVLADEGLCALFGLDLATPGDELKAKAPATTSAKRRPVPAAKQKQPKSKGSPGKKRSARKR